MEWAYVAGYFDGEGHVSLHPTARGGFARGLGWTNTDKESLEAMQRFMGAGRLRSRRLSGFGKRECWELKVNRKRDLVRILDAILPHLLVKREAAGALRAHLDSVEEASPNVGKVAGVPSKQLLSWYHDEGKSFAVIARTIGSVSTAAVAQAFRQRGFPRRPAGGAFLRGQVKAPETIARMKAAQQKRWSDPQASAAGRRRLSEARTRAWARRRANKEG